MLANATSLMGQLVVLESFDYPANQLPGNGGIGWASSWVSQASNDFVRSPGLAYPGLANTGNALVQSGGSFVSRDLSQPIVAANGGSMTISLLMKPSSDGTPVSQAVFGAYTGSDTFAIGDLPQSDPNARNWALQNSTGEFYSSVPVEANRTTLLVARIDFSAGNERMRMWIDPPLDPLLSTCGNFENLEGTTAAVDVTNAQMNQFSSVFHQQNFLQNDTAIDEITICAQAVPEPSSFLCLGLMTMWPFGFRFYKRFRLRQQLAAC